jgi:prophage tail gpP-like protein
MIAHQPILGFRSSRVSFLVPIKGRDKVSAVLDCDKVFNEGAFKDRAAGYGAVEKPIETGM